MARAGGPLDAACLFLVVEKPGQVGRSQPWFCFVVDQVQASSTLSAQQDSQSELKQPCRMDPNLKNLVFEPRSLRDVTRMVDKELLLGGMHAQWGCVSIPPAKFVLSTVGCRSLFSFCSICIRQRAQMQRLDMKTRGSIRDGCFNVTFSVSST